MSKKITLLLLIAFVLLLTLSGCRQYFAGNYPNLVVDDYSYSSTGEITEEITNAEGDTETVIIGEIYTLTVKIRNNALEGEFMIYLDFNDSTDGWYGPVYITDVEEKPFTKKFYYIDQARKTLPDTRGTATIYSLKKDDSKVYQTEFSF